MIFFDGDGEGVENLWGAVPDFLHIVPLGSLGSLPPSGTLMVEHHFPG